MQIKIGDTVTINPEILDTGEAVYGTVTVVDGNSIAFTDQSGTERTEPRWDLIAVDRIGLIEYRLSNDQHYDSTARGNDLEYLLGCMDVVRGRRGPALND